MIHSGASKAVHSEQSDATPFPHTVERGLGAAGLLPEDAPTAPALAPYPYPYPYPYRH
jgi:hypothetical protein